MLKLTNKGHHMKKLNQNGFSPFETVLLVLVVAALGFAGYVVFQNNKPAETPVTTSVTETAKPAPKKPEVTVNHASRFALFEAQTKDYVAVDITIKNPSTTAVNIDTNNFQLKDAQGNSYKSYKEVLNGDSDNVVIGQALPKGDTLLSNKSLAAGDIVKGTLVYSAQNTLSTFTLSLDGAMYQVTIN